MTIAKEEQPPSNDMTGHIAPYTLHIGGCVGWLSGGGCSTTSCFLFSFGPTLVVGQKTWTNLNKLFLSVGILKFCYKMFHSCPPFFCSVSSHEIFNIL